jgi:ethanolamine utilization protein EutN
MLTATVIGSVWATRRLAELPNGAFLEVEAEGTGQRLIAFDVLGSGVGERVLVTQGSVAAAWFSGKPPPVDALIIGSIDPDPEDPKTPEDPETLKAPETPESVGTPKTPEGPRTPAGTGE